MSVPWSDPVQGKYLYDHVPLCELAHEKDQGTEWLDDFFVKFFSRFPPKSIELQTRETEMAGVKKQISKFFQNNVGSQRKPSGDTKTQLRKALTRVLHGQYGNRKKPKPLPHNAFCTVYNLEDSIREEYKAIVAAAKAAEPPYEPENNVAYRNRRLREMLELSTKDVKKTVAEYAERAGKLVKPNDDSDLVFAGEDSLPDAEKKRRLKLRKRQRAIDHVELTLDVLGEVILEETGMALVALASGPEMRRMGRYRNIVVTHGASLSGTSLEQFHPNFQLQVVRPFVSFARSRYTEKQLEFPNIPYSEDDEAITLTSGVTEPATTSTNLQMASGSASTTAKSSSSSSKSATSHAYPTRVPVHAPATPLKSSTRANALTRVPTLIVEENIGLPEMGVPPTQEFLDAVEADLRKRLGPLYSPEAVDLTTPPSTQHNPIDLTTPPSTMHNPIDLTRSSSPVHVHHVKKESSSPIPIPLTPTPAVAPAIVPATPASPSTPTPATTPPAPARARVLTLPAPAPARILVPATPTRDGDDSGNESEDMPLAQAVAPAPAIAPALNALPLSDAVIAALPEWAKDPATQFNVHFLNAASLLRSWARYEVVYSGSIVDDGRIPTLGRPPQVAKWMKEHRRLENIPAFPTALFSRAWIEWYGGGQKFRQNTNVAGWPLSRDVPRDADWDLVRKSGKNGMFMFLLTLYWWHCAVRDDEDVGDDYRAAVADLEWLFDSLTAMGVPEKKVNDTQGKKRKVSVEMGSSPVLRDVRRRR